jgi:hypothetical protein
MSVRLDIPNINTELLDSINKVRKGEVKNITIYYHYSNIEKNLPSSISFEDFKLDTSTAFAQWALAFNSIYTSSRFIKGNLQLKFKESESSKGIKIKFSGVKYVAGDKNVISLSTKVNWTPGFALQSNPLLSALVYGIGRVLGFPTVNDNSPMNLANVKMDYSSLSSLKFKDKILLYNGLKNYKTLIKDILYIYGNINNTNNIVYGCTAPGASNYNIKANRNDNSCIFPDTNAITALHFNPIANLNSTFKVIISGDGTGTLNYKGLKKD